MYDCIIQNAIVFAEDFATGTDKIADLIIYIEVCFNKIHIIYIFYEANFLAIWLIGYR